MKRSLVEEAQRELNDILGREQSPEDFERDVQARLQRMNARAEKKEKRKVSANRSLFKSL